MLSDERQILNLLHLYCELQDAADFEAVCELFRHGAFRIETGPAARGFDEVYALKTKHDRVHEDGTLRTKHITTNTRLELAPDGRSARAFSYFTVFQATPRLPLQCIIAGRYDDTLEKVDGQWRFSDRLIRADLVGDLSEHTMDNPLKDPLKDALDDPPGNPLTARA